MLLVLGATSSIGRHVVHNLCDARIPTRVIVPAREALAPLEFASAQVYRGDSRDGTALREALRGADGVVLITRTHPEQVAYEQHVIATLQRLRVPRVIKLSIAGSAPDASFLVGRWHWQTEQLLESTGLAWTVVRAHRPMQHIYSQMDSLRSQRAMYGCQGHGASPDIDQRDTARVLSHLAASGAHAGEALHITGPAAVSATEVARLLGRAMHEEIAYVDCAPDDFTQAQMAGGLASWRAENRSAWQAAVRDGELQTPTETVQRITGQSARSYAQFAAEFAASIRYARCPQPRAAAIAE